MNNDSNDSRPTNLFVCFNDSDSDPTWASAYDAHLVIGYDDAEDDNPCAEDKALDRCKVIPQNLEEMKAFVDMVGWSLEFDKDGQAVLYTGVYKKLE